MMESILAVVCLLLVFAIIMIISISRENAKLYEELKEANQSYSFYLNAYNQSQEYGKRLRKEIEDLHKINSIVRAHLTDALNIIPIRF